MSPRKLAHLSAGTLRFCSRMNTRAYTAKPGRDQPPGPVALWEFIGCSRMQQQGPLQMLDERLLIAQTLSQPGVQPLPPAAGSMRVQSRSAATLHRYQAQRTSSGLMPTTPLHAPEGVSPFTSCIGIQRLSHPCMLKCL